MQQLPAAGAQRHLGTGAIPLLLLTRAVLWCAGRIQTMLVARGLSVVLLFVIAQFTTLWHIQYIILPMYVIRYRATAIQDVQLALPS